MDWTQFLCGIPARDYIFQKEPYEEQITQASAYLKEADHVLIGAGAGLSAAAGLTYSGKRFQENFSDFIKKYGLKLRKARLSGQSACLCLETNGPLMACIFHGKTKPIWQSGTWRKAWAAIVFPSGNNREFLLKYPVSIPKDLIAAGIGT